MPPRNISAPAADAPLTAQEARSLIDPIFSFGPVALAVSGGPDSMQLMYMAASSKGSEPVHVLTVDHQLRAESAHEAEFVGNAANALGLEHAILSWKGEKRGKGIQEAARKARYSLMAQWCVENGVSALVTAHNLDDQAETVLMRLARGSGPDGLAAMQHEARLFGITVLRPLLEVPHARLVASLKSAGHAYIEDPSNADLQFERVRIRKARAARDALGLSDKALAATARRMARAVSALSAATDQLVERAVKVSQYGCCSIEPSAIETAAEDIKLRLLARCLNAVGGAEWPPSDDQLAGVLNWIEEGAERPRTLGGCRLAKRKGALVIAREYGRIQEKSLPIARTGKAIWDGRFEISVSGKPPGELSIHPLGPKGWIAVKEMRPNLPAFAGHGLPAVSCDGELLGVPLPGFEAIKPSSNFEVSARFVGKFAHRGCLNSPQGGK